MDNIFFLGIVEQIDDPKKLGRIKVRQIHEYSDRVSADDIPWALPLMPSNSATYLGIGDSPTGIQVGSRVIGFFLDGKNKSKPVILGTYPIILAGDENQHSLSTEARGIGPVQKDYFEYEPRSEYAAQYPFNRTTNTRSGHVIEIDDTPRSERIHIFHRSGSYIEFFPDGNIVTKADKSNFDICRNDKSIITDDGDINIISNRKNINVTADENINVASANADISIRSGKNTGIIADEGLVISGKNSVELLSDGKMTISASNIEMDCDTLNIDGDLNIKGNVNVRGMLMVNGRMVMTK